MVSMGHSVSKFVPGFHYRTVEGISIVTLVHPNRGAPLRQPPRVVLSVGPHRHHYDRLPGICYVEMTEIASEMLYTGMA